MANEDQIWDSFVWSIYYLSRLFIKRSQWKWTWKKNLSKDVIKKQDAMQVKLFWSDETRPKLNGVCPESEYNYFEHWKNIQLN